MDTNQKGDLATVKVITDLVEKGFRVFLPISEHGVVDAVALKDEKVIRLQIKHSSDGVIRRDGVVTTTKGKIYRRYKLSDFDFYGVYLPTVDVVIYVPIHLGGILVRTNLLGTRFGEYWWYKDFLELENSNPEKSLLGSNSDGVVRITAEKVKEMIWNKPIKEIAKGYNIDAKTLAKWCKKHDIEKPPRGYWLKKN